MGCSSSVSQDQSQPIVVQSPTKTENVNVTNQTQEHPVAFDQSQQLHREYNNVPTNNHISVSVEQREAQHHQEPEKVIQPEPIRQSDMRGYRLMQLQEKYSATEGEQAISHEQTEQVVSHERTEQEKPKPKPKAQPKASRPKKLEVNKLEQYQPDDSDIIDEPKPVKKRAEGVHVEQSDAPAKRPPPEELVLLKEEQGIKYFAGKKSQKIKSIHVAAGVAKSFIEDNEGKIMAQNQFLKHIYITFNPEETDNVDYFITNIFNTSNYTQIYVHMEQLTMFSPEAVETFAQTIGNLPLKCFGVRSYYDDFSDDFFAILKPNLLNLTGTLKSLYFSLYQSQNITNQIFTYLREVLEGMNGLEELGLRFQQTLQLQSSAFAELKEALLGKPKLTLLAVDIAKAEKMTDDMLTYLGEVVVSLPKITTLEVNVWAAYLSSDAINQFADTQGQVSTITGYRMTQ